MGSKELNQPHQMVGPDFNLFNCYVEFNLMVFNVTYYIALIFFAENVSFHKVKSIHPI